MSSNSQMLAQVIQTTGATKADVLRVATQGGTTRADWDIARAIQAAGGRDAYELMLLAGRDAEIAAIWADSRAEAEPPAPTNPLAKTTAGVRIYPEDTSPESPNQIAPHHPNDTDEDQDETEQLRIRAWAAIAAITSATKEVIDRMVAQWITPSAIYTGVANVLKASRHPRARKLRDTYVTAA